MRGRAAHRGLGYPLCGENRGAWPLNHHPGADEIVQCGYDAHCAARGQGQICRLPEHFRLWGQDGHRSSGRGGGPYLQGGKHGSVLPGDECLWAEL